MCMCVLEEKKTCCLIDFLISNFSKRIISKRTAIFMEFTVQEESRVTKPLSSRGVYLQFPLNLLSFRKFSPPTGAAKDKTLTSAPVQCLQSGFLTPPVALDLSYCLPSLPLHVKLYHLLLHKLWPKRKKRDFIQYQISHRKQWIKIFRLLYETYF